ncbi:MAG: carboxypeptidase-like regulatory domain-containing protein, partial [Blastocatellia bacterium]
MLREQDGTPDGLRRVMAEQVLTALERSDARRLVCATQPAPPDFNPVAEHVERHQFTELCFCLRGRAEMWVGSQLASCEENQVVIIPAGLALLLFLNAAQGQVLTGSIEGTIKDEQGAVVAGVEIVALRTETNLTRRLQCNESGFFRFEQLPIGRYR